MLNSISWSDFLTVLAILAGAYYLVVVLVFYRREIVDFIRNGSSLKRSREPAPTTNEKPLSVSRSLMGAAVDDDDSQVSSDVSREASDQLAYASSDELPEEVGASFPGADEMLVGRISDLMEEIKAICLAIADSNADKNEAASLFETLLSNYQQLKGTPYQKSVNDYIYSVTRDPFPLFLTREDIQSFWSDRV